MAEDTRSNSEIVAEAIATRYDHTPGWYSEDAFIAVAALAAAGRLRDTTPTRDVAALIAEIEGGDFEDRAWMIDALSRASEALQGLQAGFGRVLVDIDRSGDA